MLEKLIVKLIEPTDELGRFALVIDDLIEFTIQRVRGPMIFVPEDIRTIHHCQAFSERISGWKDLLKK